MTDTNTYRKKGRAVFLAAIMVLSMVAMSAAFVGPAAAATIDRTPAEETIDVGESVDITINVEADDGDELLTYEEQIPDGLTVSDVNADSGSADSESEDNNEVLILYPFTETEDTITFTVTADEGTEGENFDLSGTMVTDQDEFDTSVTSITVNEDDGTAGVTIDDFNAPAEVPQGETLESDVTVTNNDDESVTDDVVLDLDGQQLDSETLDLDPGETTTVDLSAEIAVESGSYDLTASTSDDSVTQVLSVTDPLADAARIEGDIADTDSNVIDNAEDIEVTFTATGEAGNIFFSETVTFDNFATLEDSPVVERADFFPSEDGEFDEYVVEIATDGETDYEIEANLEGFNSFTSPTITLGPGQVTTDAAIRLERDVTADRLTVLDDGELDRIVDAANNNDFPLDDDPESLVSTTADAEDTVGLDIFTETEDNAGFGSSIGELAPFANEDDEIDALDVSVDGAGLDASNVNLDPSIDQTDTSADTDESGLTAVDVSLTGVDFENLDENVNVDIAFNASSNTDEANDVVTITFVPDVGDTGTISGEVDKIVDQQLGTASTVPEENRSSNIESAENVPVWAVQLEDIEQNTVVLEDGQGIDTEIPDNLVDDGYTQSLTEVSTDEDRQFRVVTYDEEGDEVIQDPRSDYLTTTDEFGQFSGTNIELIQNETSIGFDVHQKDPANTDASIGLHFLAPEEDPGYQVQQYTPVSNTTQTQYVWQNVTVDEQATGSTPQTVPEETFDVGVDLRYDAVDDRFDQDFVNPTDFTNENGGYELLNLPTSQDGTPQQYMVIAGAGDSMSADGPEDVVGFANFRGYDTVTVEPNTQDGQFNVDLSVQDFEPAIDLIYDIDVTAQDRSTNDFENQVRIPAGSQTTVQFDVSVRQAGDSEEDAQPADGIELDTELLEDQALGFNNAGDLVDDTVTVEDGVATTTFEAVSSTDFLAGETELVTNATAETNEVTDRDGNPFRAEGEEQAQIEVFLDAEIEGDVVDQEGNLVFNSTVSLYEIQDDGSLELIRTANTGTDGSFSFTGVPSGADYRVEAVDEEGNTGFNEGQLEDLPAGTTTAGITIVDAVIPDQATFQVSDLEPEDATVTEGDDPIDVTATVENIGDLEGAQNLTLEVEGEAGNVVFSDESAEIELAPGADAVVEFTDVPAGSLDVGDYEHTVASDDDSVTGTLTVEAEDDNGDEPEEHPSGVTQEQFDAINSDGGDLTLGNLQDAVSEWSDTEQVNGVDVNLGDLQNVVSWWSDQQ